MSEKIKIMVDARSEVNLRKLARAVIALAMKRDDVAALTRERHESRDTAGVPGEAA